MLSSGRNRGGAVLLQATSPMRNIPKEHGILQTTLILPIHKLSHPCLESPHPKGLGLWAALFTALHFITIYLVVVTPLPDFLGFFPMVFYFITFPCFQDFISFHEGPETKAWFPWSISVQSGLKFLRKFPGWGEKKKKKLQENLQSGARKG